MTELLFFGDKTHKFLFFNPTNPNNRITRIDTASGSYLNWKILFEIADEAANGETALDLCRKLRPGVVLLDINMPGMDGLMVLRAIHKQFPATKVVMISAEATMERVKEAIACGAAGFIVKPFNAIRVLSDITAVLDRKR